MPEDVKQPAGEAPVAAPIPDVASACLQCAGADALPLIDRLQKLSRMQLLTMHFAEGAWLDLSLVDPLYDCLRSIPKSRRLGLYLRSQGGVAEVPWRIVSLVREFCTDLTVMVPDLALSGGTHIAIAADRLVMGDLSALGSVDPTRQHPLLPKDARGNPIPTSVQDLKECVGFLKEQLGRSHTAADMSPILAAVMEHVDPLAIGALEQSYKLSRLITRKVLESRRIPPRKQVIRRVVDRLSGEYYSHAFLISRREVEEDLLLPVARPTNQQWEAMRDLCQHYRGVASRTHAITLAGDGGAGRKCVLRCTAFIGTMRVQWVLCHVVYDEQIVSRNWVKL